MKSIPMGRANYAILAMGIASMLILSLLMKQFLHKAEDKKELAVLSELSAMFGGRLDKRCEVEFEQTERGPRAVVTVYPVASTPVSTLR